MAAAFPEFGLGLYKLASEEKLQKRFGKGGTGCG